MPTADVTLGVATTPARRDRARTRPASFSKRYLLGAIRNRDGTPVCVDAEARATDMIRGLVLADGEPEIVASAATLLAVSARGDSAGGVTTDGTIGPAARSYATDDDSPVDVTHVDPALAVVDTGQLIKTDRRLIFLGASESVEIDLSDVLMWDLEGSVLRVYAEEHPLPHLFGLDSTPDELHQWSDHVENPTVVLDPGDDGSRMQPGFPNRILLSGDGLVVDADPLLPFAASLLDTWPSGDLVDPRELAGALGITVDRAAAVLAQLEALGFTSSPDSDGERTVFDPDGTTTPAGDLQAARGEDVATPRP